MNRTVELAIAISSSAATAGFDATSTAAKAMRDDVESAASGAATGLDRVGASADDLDSKAGRATGALGALSAGFELVGAEKYAGALQAAAMATDFASGVGQAFTLILELESVRRAKAVVMAGAHAVATTAQAGAAKAAAAGQWVLNAALAANPVGLVVIAVLALVAAVVIAYKRSETFRAIVQAAMAAATAAVQAVIAKVSDLVSWVGGRASAVWTTLRDAVSTTLATIREKFAPVQEVAERVFGAVKEAITTGIDKAKGAVEGFKTAAVTAFDAVMVPINKIIDGVQNIIDKIANIDFPDLPNLPGFSRQQMRGPSLGPSTTMPGQTVINLNVTPTPLTDVNALATQLLAALNSALVASGRAPVVV